MTALYEIVPAGTAIDLPGIDPLKYQRPAAPAAGAARDELMTVKLRYKAPDADESRLLSVAVKNATGELSPNLGFAAAVAEFGMLLRQSPHRGSATHAERGRPRAPLPRSGSRRLPRGVHPAGRARRRARPAGPQGMRPAKRLLTTTLLV